jgi:hypothetical protein
MLQLLHALARIRGSREQEHPIPLSPNTPHQAMIATVIVLALLSALVATEPDPDRDPE